ncbi:MULTISPECIES: hypothetical protein [unclassified Methylobacterium]|uniref:hypothetical protein n=1 Tax=unclassified Methylobacterium TaxID=2615210 RepID=UPI0011C1FFAB|nr:MULTISPECIES: hypothetical protein [unclassified Methylobacterium]QEE40163.1 hypothetical protein FVA80_15480 [Methylobacterium sp. WL1]TXN58405.1 hypothetical protein FV241_07405 [Methylobacterium sp. WL2]
MTKIEAKPALSPDELLKAVVAGKANPKPEPVSAPAAVRFAMPALAGPEVRRYAIAGTALALGLILGFAARPGAGGAPSDAVLALSTTVDAGRTETARLGADIAQLHQVLADLRAATDTARKEAGSRSSALGERLAQLDKNLNTKSAALSERIEQGEREQSVRMTNLAAQLERRASVAASAVKSEPTQTGSLAETRAADAKVAEVKAIDAKNAEAKGSETKGSEAKGSEAKSKSVAAEKPAVIDGWAVRDVFDGAAILENKRRRIVEVGPGDMLPGIGRVEGVERRGREWVVVTRQGLVTPQPW